jgi:hypothetical protein
MQVGLFRNWVDYGMVAFRIEGFQCFLMSYPEAWVIVEFEAEDMRHFYAGWLFRSFVVC